jgi:IstB-like ATP binding protein
LWTIARACIRGGARGRFYTVVDLVNRLKSEVRASRQGRLAEYLTRMDFIVLDELGTYSVRIMVLGRLAGQRSAFYKSLQDVTKFHKMAIVASPRQCHNLSANHTILL